MATPSAIRETVEYRVVLVQRDSPTVLAFGVLGCYCLPRVRIPQLIRPAQQLRKEIHIAWGLEVLIVEIIMTGKSRTSCVVAELLTPRIISEFTRVRFDQISVSDLSDEERLEVQLLLEGKSTNPLSHIGWIDEVVAWVETAAGQTFSSKKDTEQLNAGRGFALLRFHSDDGFDYWLKATGEPNTHEPSITACLSRLCGVYLPEFIASKPEWNAWLMSASQSCRSSPSRFSICLRMGSRRWQRFKSKRRDGI